MNKWRDLTIPVCRDENFDKLEKERGAEFAEAVTEVVDDEDLLEMMETVLLAEETLNVRVSFKRGQE